MVPSDPADAQAAPAAPSGAAPQWSLYAATVRVAAVALALLGLWLSFDLLLLSANASATNPWLEARCGPSADGRCDCASVLASRFARMNAADPQRPGPPWAAAGMAYFLFVFLWYAFIGRPSRSRWYLHLPIVFVVGFGALVSVDLLNVMASQLRQWCWGCAAAHTLNAGLVACTAAAFPWRRDTVGRPPHPSLALAAAVFIAGVFGARLTVATVEGFLLAKHYEDLKSAYTGIVSDPAFVQWKHATATPVEIPEIPGDAPSESAAHTLVVFSDFQCPRCKALHASVAEVRRSHPGALRVLYRQYPLNSTCNEQVAQCGHPSSCEAAYAAEAARQVGGPAALERMVAVLYANQAQLDTRRFADWAAEAGLDRAAFDAAFESPAVRARVAADVAAAAKLKLKGTPYVFLDGRPLEHWTAPGAWDALLGSSPATQGAAP